MAINIQNHLHLKGKKRKILLTIFSVIVIFTVIFVVWANSSYKGIDIKPKDIQSTYLVQIEENNKYISIIPNDFLNAATKRSFIF